MKVGSAWTSRLLFHDGAWVRAASSRNKPPILLFGACPLRGTEMRAPVMAPAPSDLPLQPVLGWRGEDADRVPVADPAGVSGGQLEEPDLLPDERGSSEGVVLLPGEQRPAKDGELSGHGLRGKHIRSGR